MMSKFKFGEQSVMPALLENNTYMKYEKFNTHKKDSINWLRYVNPVISLQRTTREKISNALMLVHLNDEEMTAMKHTHPKKSLTTPRGKMKSYYRHSTYTTRRQAMAMEQTGFPRQPLTSGVIPNTLFYSKH